MAAARPSRASRRAAKCADRPAPRARAACRSTRCRSSRSGCRGLAAMRRWLARHGAGFDVINTHSSTDAWLAALARATLPRAPPIVRTRHVSTPVNRLPTTRWLYQRATRAHRRHRRSAQDAARARQRLSIRQRSRRCAPASISRASRLATAPRCARNAASTHDRRSASWRRCATGRGTTTCSTRGRALQATVPGWQLLVIGDGPRRAHLERRVQALALAEQRALHRQPGRRAGLARVPRTSPCCLPMATKACRKASCRRRRADCRPSPRRSARSPKRSCDGETGLLVPPRDVACACGGAGDLDDATPAQRVRMGRAAHAYAQAHFGIDAMLDAMEAIFARVAARAR